MTINVPVIKCAYCGYGEYVVNNDWHRAITRRNDHELQCTNNPIPWEDAALIREQELTVLYHRVEQFAIAYHKDIEGEYGCPGLTCPGVKRLITFAMQCVDEARRL